MLLRRARVVRVHAPRREVHRVVTAAVETDDEAHRLGRAVARGDVARRTSSCRSVRVKNPALSFVMRARRGRRGPGARRSDRPERRRRMREQELRSAVGATSAQASRAGVAAAVGARRAAPVPARPCPCRVPDRVARRRVVPVRRSRSAATAPAPAARPSTADGDAELPQPTRESRRQGENRIYASPTLVPIAIATLDSSPTSARHSSVASIRARAAHKRSEASRRSDSPRAASASSELCGQSPGLKMIG